MSSTIRVECIIFYVEPKSVGSDSDAECPITDNDEEDSLDDLVFLWVVTTGSGRMPLCRQNFNCAPRQHCQLRRLFRSEGIYKHHTICELANQQTDIAN